MSRMKPRIRLEKVAIPITPADLTSCLRSSPSTRSATGPVRCMQALEHGGRKQWEHDLVVSDQQMTLAAFLRGTAQDIGLRPIGRQEIHIHRGETSDRIAEIAGQRERFQRNLRRNHRRAEGEIAAAIETSATRRNSPQFSPRSLAAPRP